MKQILKTSIHYVVEGPTEKPVTWFIIKLFTNFGQINKCPLTNYKVN